MVTRLAGAVDVSFGKNLLRLLTAAIVMGFGCRPTRTCQRAPGPASESRQRTKPRGPGHPADQRALWGNGWHRCRGMGPKMLARQWMQATDTKTEAGPHAARSSI